MTYKNKLIFSFFLIIFTAIGAGGFGWNWFLMFNECNQARHEINRLMDNQDNLLLTYGLFAEHSLTEDKKLGFQKLIDMREPLLRANVEHFKEHCHSKSNQRELIGFLKGYDIYILSKKNLLKENEYQNTKWIREHYPYED